MTLYLLDGHALAYRAYFAFVRNPLINSKGENTGAVFGFFRTLLQLVRKYNPDYIAAVFDSPEETARHREYAGYKAHREEMPDDMVSQLPRIFDLVEAYGVPVIARPGYEADDILATLAREADSKGMDVRIVTGDKDFFQLLSKSIHIIRPGKGTFLEDEIGPEFLRKRFGLGPGQIVDLMALMGDSSDNIPGVRGIGEKTALKLLQEYGSLDGILENLDTVEPDNVRRKLDEGRESAFLSRELVALREVPLDVSIGDFAPGERDAARLSELLLELEFHQILREISLDVPPASKEHDYRIIDRGELEAFVQSLASAGTVVVDVETTSLDPLVAGLVGISFCTEEGRARYIPVAPEPNGEKDDLFGDDGEGDGRGFSLETLRAVLGPLLADESVSKIGHNIKYDMLVLEANRFTVRGVFFDTMIASYCLDPERRSHSLDTLASEFCRHNMIRYSDLFPKGDRVRDIRTVPLEKLAGYSCEDADYTYRLYGSFAPSLDKFGLERLFREVEMPLSLVLKRMEQEGVAIDAGKLEKLSGEISGEMGGLVTKIHNSAGEQFNINSNRQLQHILFEKLGLPRLRKTKTGYSTDVEVLTELASKHEIARLILEYRQLSKMASTYVDALPRLVNPVTGRIHTSFNQTVTSTGRLSSSDPNLQNIPIRTGLGRKIRSAFIPREGNVMMDADYSQIELRIMAHLSGDPALVEAFREGHDIHTRTAARIYQVDEADVDGKMRASAKTINFGVIYGMGARGLSKQLGITFDEAKAFIEEYFRTYPGVKEYIDRSVEEARKKMYAETLLGRRRPIEGILSDDGRIRSFSERIAVNMPVQGTAADMIKVAMVEIDRAIRRRGLGSRMIIQVHDELVFDVVPGEAEVMQELVSGAMESALELDVPLRVEIGTGANWLEAH